MIPTYKLQPSILDLSQVLGLGLIYNAGPCTRLRITGQTQNNLITPTVTPLQNTKEHESVSWSHLQIRPRSDFSLPVCNRSQIPKFRQRMLRSEEAQWWQCARKHASPNPLPDIHRWFHGHLSYWQKQKHADETGLRWPKHQTIKGWPFWPCQATIEWRRARQILDHNPWSQREFFHIFLLKKFQITEVSLLGGTHNLRMQTPLMSL